MSISYNTNIPFSTHNPSNDQPLMETNTNSINSWVQVDHVGFNVGGGEVSGQHNQVTFNSNNVPTPPVSPPVLFTNNVNSLPQLFFYSGNSSQSSSQYSLTEGSPGATNTGGSTFLLGGIVLKWGIVSATDNTSISFATLSGAAFPTACFAVYATEYNSSSSNGFFISVSPTPTAAAFTPRVRTSAGGAGTVVISYLALGY
jgi:hypothetical protein